MLVDSHCHLDRLDLSIFDNDLEGALQNAAVHDVSYMLCVCLGMDNFADVLGIAKAHDNIFASVGVHPNEPANVQHSHDPQADELVLLADDSNIVAIGETGLDYYRHSGDLGWQQDRFRQHIAAAKQTAKPLIIHTRNAREDTLKIMQEEGASDAGGVMHCFAEDWQTARTALDMGFYISFSGIVTFNNAQELKEIAKRVPSDRILVETDSPYLAPMPHRGKPNQPAWVKYVAEHIAQLRGEDYESIAELTTENFFTLFASAVRQ